MKEIKYYIKLNILILINLYLNIIIKINLKYYSLSSYIILNIIIKHLKILYLILIIQFWFKRIENIITNGNILILLNLHLYIIIKLNTKYYYLLSYIILYKIIKHLKNL